MPSADERIAKQLSDQRRSVDFDTFDITLRELLAMLNDGAIDIAPVYQRQFRWDTTRCSQLIESIYLGIPVPSLFMATNADGTWELVDGVQRISTIVKFMGSQVLRETLKVGSELALEGLEKLEAMNGRTFNSLPRHVQLAIEMRPLKVITLSDKSDPIVRYDLFERLNRGGVTLTNQEVRDCVFRGRFSEFLDEMVDNQDFKRLVRLTKTQEEDGTRKECTLRFFAFFHRYKEFVHDVEPFLTAYMKDASAKFNYRAGRDLFVRTFADLSRVMNLGIRRRSVPRKITPINLFEGVAVGAAMAIKSAGKLSSRDHYKWLESVELKEFTGQATNSPKSVVGRIEFCRDRFLGN